MPGSSWGTTRPPWSGFGARNEARPSRRICQATSSCSSVEQRRSSTAPGTSANTGRQVRDVQRRVRHSAIPWMAATLDGIVEGTEAVFEAKFMLPWSFSEEAAAEKYMAQLQHNMWVTHLRTSVLSIITGGGKWVEVTISDGPALSHCSGVGGKEILALRPVRRSPAPHHGRAAKAAHRGHPHCRYELVELVAEFAALFRNTREAFLDHERAKSELKALMPEGRQGGDRAWGAGQAVESGGGDL